MDARIFNHGSFGCAALRVMEDWSDPKLKMKQKTNYTVAQALHVLFDREESICSKGHSVNYLWWSVSLCEGYPCLEIKPWRLASGVKVRQNRYRYTALDKLCEDEHHKWEMLFPDDIEGYGWECEAERQYDIAMVRHGIQFGYDYLSRVDTYFTNGGWYEDDAEEGVESSEIIYTRTMCPTTAVYMPLAFATTPKMKSLEVCETR